MPETAAVIDVSDRVAAEGAAFTLPPEFDASQRLSVGIHPWSLAAGLPEGLMEAVEAVAARPEVALIGEAGIDLPKGGPLFRQLQVFRSMTELSERLGKPLLIHDVRAHDIILGLHRDLRPRQTWIIHGFRRKPAVAEMFLKAGMMLSFGPLHNAETVRMMPEESILCETDDSGKLIGDVIASLSEIRRTDMRPVVAANAMRILGN